MSEPEWQCARCDRKYENPEAASAFVCDVLLPSGASTSCAVVELLTQATGAKRANGGKVRMSLIPPVVMLELAAVLTRGAVKYQVHNWRKGLTYSSTYDSLQRHLAAWWDGEENDSESGLHHLAHVLCNAAFLLTYVRDVEAGKLSKEIDDRYRVPTT